MILMANRTFRGAFFNVWRDPRDGRLIKSFPISSLHFNSDAPAVLGDPLIGPQASSTRTRKRYAYALPTGARRLVELDLAQIDPAFGEYVADAYMAASVDLAAIGCVTRETPVFCRFGNRGPASSELRACIQAQPRLRALLSSGWSSIHQGTAGRVLHGSFSVGNIVVAERAGRPSIIYDNGAFIGPVEYDVATLLETMVDLINKAQLMGFPAGELPTLVQRTLARFDVHFAIDREVLKAITVYQYIGHLHLYDTLMQRKGGATAPVAAFLRLTSTFIDAMDELM